MKQSNFSVKLFTQTVLVFVLLSVLLTFVFTSAASAQDYRYKVQNDGEVFGYAAGGSAAYTNLLGAIFSDTQNYQGPSPMISNRDTLGSVFNFGTHSADSLITFFTLVQDTGAIFSSNTANNADGIAHMYTSQFFLPDGTGALFVGFEDLYGGGDYDRNDVMAIFTNVVMAPVPEPSSIAMLLAGLGLLGFTRGSFLS